MKDELKIFTDKNRESFEKYRLDIGEAWNGIEDRLEDIENVQSSTWRIFLKIAAIIVVIVSVAFGFYLNNQRISYNNNGIALHCTTYLQNWLIQRLFTHIKLMKKSK